MNLKRTFVGFLGVLLVTASFAAETSSSESPSSVAAKAPVKPWSVNASYAASRSFVTGAEAAAADAALGANWAFSPALQAGILLASKNAIGVGPVLGRAIDRQS